MSPRQPRLIPVTTAATLTGQPEATLSQWCATGRLDCERVADTWYLLESDLHRAAEMRARVHREYASGRAVLALAFADAHAGRQAFDELRHRFGAGAGDLAIGPMSLDGREFVLIAGAFPDDSTHRIEEIAQQFGGLVVDDRGRCTDG